MIIPYSTDAPIYHWPYATGGTIAANVLAIRSSTRCLKGRRRRLSPGSP